MSNPAEFVQLISDFFDKVFGTQIPVDTLWNFTFYGTLVSALLPLFAYGSRFYIFLMNSTYLMFSQDFKAMFYYWGSLFTEPVRYLQGIEGCERFSMGYYSYTKCEVLAAEVLSSTLGLVGYAVGLPFDYFLLKATSRPSLEERQAFVQDGTTQNWTDIGIIQAGVIYAISTVLGVLTVIYGYYNQ
jgi:hypothetical protein